MAEGMEIGVVIVAHGGLAREYLAAVEHVLGPQSGMRAVAIEADHNRLSKAAEIRAATEAVDCGAGVVLVTDLHGGSPSNLSQIACCSSSSRNRATSGSAMPSPSPWRRGASTSTAAT